MHEQIGGSRQFSSFVATPAYGYRLFVCACNSELRMKTISLSLLTMMTLGAGAGAAPASKHSVSLTQNPLIMRLNKDEFRIAFGINGERCGANGCSGMIHYRVNWKSADGATRSETRHVSYTVLPRSHRTIAVDRQYFDTAEGQQTTDVVNVRIDAITCRDGSEVRTAGIQQL
jgi:hypothetical protein